MNFTLGSQFRGEIKDYTTVQASLAEPQPDTLDLGGMARMALNYLRGNPDPGRNYECKFSLGPLGIPFWVPMVPSNESGFDVISLGDTDCRMDMQYAHMRAMAGGEPDPDPVELGVRRRVLSYLKADHLCWVNPGACVGETISGEWVSPWATAYLLYNLSETYQRTGDLKLKRQTRQILLALKKITLWDGDRAFFWGIAPYKNGQWLLRKWCRVHGRNYPFIIEPCVRYYECTGDEEGLALARAFADGFVDGIQPEMGTQRVNPETGEFTGHVHLHTHAVWGMAHLGVVLGERRYLDWAKKTHDFVVSIGTDYGWYPEHVSQDYYRTEVCVAGDMVSLAAWLARGGYPEYWDVIERTIRNQLQKSQFFLTKSFVDLFKTIHKEKPSNVVANALKALRSIEGGFVAQSTFNDWVSYPHNPRLGVPGMYSNGIHMMGCCPPEGMRALWETWEGGVEKRKEGIFINLALSRNHELARVAASRPEDGRLDVEARTPGTYYLRPPAWSERTEWKASRNGANLPVYWGGPAQAYVVCRNVKRGEKLAVTWSVPQFTQTFRPASIPDRNEKLICRWVGSKLIEVKPKGHYLPMFK